MRCKNRYKVRSFLTFFFLHTCIPHRCLLIALGVFFFADPEPRTRTLGLAVLRGPTITLLSPVDGLEEISNPFVAQE